MRVVLVDSHPLDLEGQRVLLAAAPEVEIAAAVRSGSAAVDAIRALAPDVAVLAIQPPGFNGIELARRLRSEGLRVPLVAFSIYREAGVVLAAFDAGMLGYVLKSAPGEELIKAVRLAARGEAFLSSSHAGCLLGALGRKVIRFPTASRQRTWKGQRLAAAR